MSPFAKRPAPPNARPAEGPSPGAKVRVDEQVCHHCGACVAVCPPDAIFLENSALVIHQEICTACERCVKMCPVQALHMAAPDLRPRHA